MLTTLRDDQGQIVAVCEWWCRDQAGWWNPHGSYVWVNQVELVPGMNGRTVLRHLIQEIAAATPWAVGAYWERRDRGSERLHAYRRNQLVREEVRVTCGAA